MMADALEILKVAALTVSSARRVLTASLRGVGSEGDDTDAEAFDDAEVAQPAGLMASPALTPTTEAVGFRRGDELVALVLLDKGAAVQSVEAGETRLYGVGADNATAVLRIRASGVVELSPKAGQDAVLAGGTLKTARVTDPVCVGTLTATAGPWPVQFIWTPFDANGAPGAPVGPLPTATLAAVVSNAGGAAHVKA